GVRLKPTMRRIHKCKRKGVETFFNAQPNITALANVNVRTKRRRIALTHLAVEPVSGNEQIGVVLQRNALIVVNVGVKHKIDAYLGTALLKNIEQFLAPDADKTMTRTANGSALEMHLDVVPVIEGINNLTCRHAISFLQVFKGGIGKDDPPTERIVRSIALDYCYATARFSQLHQQAKIQPRRSSSNANDIHTSRSVPD